MAISEFCCFVTAPHEEKMGSSALNCAKWAISKRVSQEDFNPKGDRIALTPRRQCGWSRPQDEGGTQRLAGRCAAECVVQQRCHVSNLAPARTTSTHISHACPGV